MSLPTNHPHVKPEKIGVLMLNLGTPDATDYFSMRRYLSEFLSDQRVIDYPKWFWQPLLQGIILTSRPFRSGAAYKKIWNNEQNESPLKTYTRAITDKIQKQFKGQDVIFEWGMRYGNPSTEAGIKSLLDKGCRKILFFSLYPQYSAPTMATAYDKAFDVLQKTTWQPSIRTASPYHDDDAYINVLADSIVSHLKKTKAKPEVILTSFHGVPKRYLMQGDPYHCMCCKTSRLVREKLGWNKEKWITTFQSRFGPEEWLQPYTDKTVEKLAHEGVKRMAIVSPAFAVDCLETLEELAMEARDEFLDAGGEEYTYIPCLNDSKAHIDYLTKRITYELSGWI
jgi:protoporphyrin/coproporphyrin ferrochelatase